MQGAGRHEPAATNPAILGDAKPARFAPIYCPHCRCRAVMESSRQVTGQHREMYYRCSNIACSHAWRASLCYDYGLVPSAIPDPSVNLPLRPMTRQDVMDLLRDRDPAQPDMFDAPPLEPPPRPPG